MQLFDVVKSWGGLHLICLCTGALQCSGSLVGASVAAAFRNVCAHSYGPPFWGCAFPRASWLDPGDPQQLAVSSLYTAISLLCFVFRSSLLFSAG
jgi:hypothetical protein